MSLSNLLASYRTYTTRRNRRRAEARARQSRKETAGASRQLEPLEPKMLLAVTLFQEAVSPDGSYEHDAVYIRSGDNNPANADANFNDDSDLELIAGVTVNDKVRVLMEFDVSTIPASDEIDHVSLVLRTETSPTGLGGPVTVNVYEYGFDINESVSTWNDPDGDGSNATGDTTPGGTLGTLLTTATFDQTAGGMDVTFSDTAAFRTAVSDAVTGDGMLRMILAHDDETITGSHDFARFDDDTVATLGNRPELVVTHTPPPGTATANFQEGVSPDGSYTHDAVYIRSGDNNPANADANFNDDSDLELIAGVTVNDKVRVLMEFDVSAIPASDQIDSASLVLRTETSPTGLGGPVTVNVYEYGFDINESVSTWNDPDGDGSNATGDTTPGGTLGTVLTTATFTQTDAGVDVTFGNSAAFRTAVSNALAGDGVLRMILTHEDETITGSYDFARFDDETVAALGDRPELVVTHHTTNQPPEIAADSAAVSADEGDDAVNTGTFSDVDDINSVTLTASVGTVTQNDAGGTWEWSIPTTDGNAGPFDVTITADDGVADPVTTMFTYTVNNVAPTVTLASPTSANEGETKSYSFTTTDPGLDTFSVVNIDGGSVGTVSNVVFDAVSGAGSFDVTFSDGHAISTVSVQVADSDAANSNVDSIDVTVNNVAPTVDNGGDRVVNEGETASNTGNYDDVGDDVVTLSASIGTVTDNNDGTYSWSFDTTDGPHESQTVTITATDSDGAATESTFQLTVNNVAPTVDAAGPFDVVENSANGTAVGSVSATDPGDDTITGYTITGGTGLTAFAVDSSGNITVADENQLDYEAATSFTLDIAATDSDGDQGDSTTVTINVIDQVNVSGFVFADLDNGGDEDFDANEVGLEGVTVELDGMTATTDSDGFYIFEDVPGSSYDIDTNVDVDAAETIIVVDDGGDLSHYFAVESTDGVQSGMSATIGFWQNKNGQGLIDAAGEDLETWLEANFGNIFSEGELDGNVAKYYKDEFFKMKLKGSPKVDAQFMATALNVYFTTQSLAVDSGNVDVMDIEKFGLDVTDGGLGGALVNVLDSGEAFDVADGSNMTVMQLLLAADSMTGAGAFYLYDAGNDGIDDDEMDLRKLANTIFTAINEEDSSIDPVL